MFWRLRGNLFFLPLQSLRLNPCKVITGRWSTGARRLLSTTLLGSFPYSAAIKRELLWLCTSCVIKKNTQKPPFQFSPPAASRAVNMGKVQPSGGSLAALTTSGGTSKEAGADGACGCAATEEQRRPGLMTLSRSMIRQISLESGVWFHPVPQCRPVQFNHIVLSLVVLCSPPAEAETNRIWLFFGGKACYSIDDFKRKIHILIHLKKTWLNKAGGEPLGTSRIVFMFSKKDHLFYFTF